MIGLDAQRPERGRGPRLEGRRSRRDQAHEDGLGRAEAPGARGLDELGFDRVVRGLGQMFENRRVDVEALHPGQGLPGGLLFGPGCPGRLVRQEQDRLAVAGPGDGPERGQPHVEGRAFRGGEERGPDGFGRISGQDGRELDLPVLGQAGHEIGDPADIGRTEGRRHHGQSGRVKLGVLPAQGFEDGALRVGTGGDLAFECGLSGDRGDVGREDPVIDGRGRGFVPGGPGSLRGEQEGRGDLGLEGGRRLSERGREGLDGLGAADLAQGLDRIGGQGGVLAGGQACEGRDRGGGLPRAEREDDRRGGRRPAACPGPRREPRRPPAPGSSRGHSGPHRSFRLERERRQDGDGLGSPDEAERPAGGHQSGRRGRALDELEQRGLGLRAGPRIVLVGEDIGMEAHGGADVGGIVGLEVLEDGLQRVPLPGRGDGRDSGRQDERRAANGDRAVAFLFIVALLTPAAARACGRSGRGAAPPRGRR